MKNPYQTRQARIVKITDQAPGVKLFEFSFEVKDFEVSLDHEFSHRPGQFVILSLPGFGEAVFAPCNDTKKNLELCIRAVGKLTNKIHTLKIGDRVGIRGPFGSGWPVNNQWQKTDNDLPTKKNLLIVVGGLGLVPLRSLLFGKDAFLGKEALVQIFYGAKTPTEFIFKNDFDQWRKNGIDLQLTIDKACPDWNGCVGLVTVLFDKRNIVPDARVFLCGPPAMYKFVLQKVKEQRIKDEHIYLSLERRMHCGVGVCQHCAVGSFYTCKHGPVFRYDQIKNVPGAI